MYFTDKYRPQHLEEVIGQEHIIKVISKILKSPQNYPKNFIFHGGFGVGKTSMARIFANLIGKCYEYDVSILGNVESMKDIKSMIDNVFLYSNEYRVVIFNEIQAARSKAQELLLDTLEDNTDSKIFFIFTTTDISKIIETLRSRCLEFNFHLIPDNLIDKHINNITIKENITINEDKIKLIVKKSKGHMRNALNYLDIYNLTDGDFESFVNDTTELLNQYIFKGIDNINLIITYPVTNLLEDLNMLMYEYIIKEDNLIFKMKFLENYMKYKNFIETHEDLKSVLHVLRKLYGSKK